MLTHEELVKAKYDTLYRSENRFRKGKAYPIHKRLNFELLGFDDIYAWLLAQLDIQASMKVLDAGCGVGYGSLMIADQTKAAVHGISLSTNEVDQAKDNAATYDMNDQVQFEIRSYDDLPPETYDFAIAIESIKHSADLSRSIRRLIDSLRPQGQLVIIEDLYQKDALTADAQALLSDYKLVDLFREQDYLKDLPKADCEIIDLSQYILPKITWKIETKLALAKWFHKINGRKKTDFSSILRGGYFLDRLYAQQLMQYKAIIYTKP